jgi:hypothetical protein
MMRVLCHRGMKVLNYEPLLKQPSCILGSCKVRVIFDRYLIQLGLNWPENIFECSPHILCTL